MDDFTCDICFEPFNIDDRRPKSVPCGHTICLACLLHSQGKGCSMRKGTTCPMDRKVFQRIQPADLPDTFYLLSRLEQQNDSQGSVPTSARGRLPKCLVWCSSCDVEALPGCLDAGHILVGMQSAPARSSRVREQRDTLRRWLELRAEVQRRRVDVAVTALRPVLLDQDQDVVEAEAEAQSVLDNAENALGHELPLWEQAEKALADTAARCSEESKLAALQLELEQLRALQRDLEALVLRSTPAAAGTPDPPEDSLLNQRLKDCVDSLARTCATASNLSSQLPQSQTVTNGHKQTEAAVPVEAAVGAAVTSPAAAPVTPGAARATPGAATATSAATSKATPATPAATPATPPPSDTRSQVFSRGTVSLDDGPVSRAEQNALLTLKLRSLNNLYCARNGDWALTLLEKNAPHLEELNLKMALPKHLRMLDNMPRLRSLRVLAAYHMAPPNGFDLRFKERPAGRQGPSVLERLAVEVDGLSFNCVRSLLFAHRRTLKEVDVHETLPLELVRLHAVFNGASLQPGCNLRVHSCDVSRPKRPLEPFPGQQTQQEMLLLLVRQWLPGVNVRFVLSDPQSD